MAGRKTKLAEAYEEQHRKAIVISRHINNLLKIQEKLMAKGGKMANGEVGALRLSADISFGLLKKRLPDLQSIEFKGEMKVQHDVTDEAMTADEWESQYAEQLETTH